MTTETIAHALAVADGADGAADLCSGEQALIAARFRQCAAMIRVLVANLECTQMQAQMNADTIKAMMQEEA